MSTLYALIFACLLLQVFNGSSDTPMESIAINEHSTLREYIAAVSDGQDEEYIPPVILSAVKPIDGAEGTSHDDASAASTTATAAPGLDDYAISTGAYVNDDGYTAAVTVPATPKIEDETGEETGAGLFDNDTGWDFILPDTVHSNRYYLVD